MTLRTYGTRFVRALETERLTTWLAMGVVGLVVLGLAQDAGAPLAPFDLDHEFSLPALLAGAGLLAAAGLALLLAEHERRDLRRAAALAFAVLAADELLSVHRRIEERLDLHWAVAFLPVVLVAGGLWIALGATLAERRRGRLVLGSGVLWMVAQGLEGALRDTTFTVAVVKESLDLVAVALLVAALFGSARARLGADRSERPAEVARELAVSLAPRRVALVLGAVIFLLGVLGALVGNDTIEAFVLDLNGEQTLPAAFSGALLFGAAALAFLLGGIWPADARDRRWWAVMGGVFLFLGIDEIAAIHEEIQEATDIHPGQLVLAPLVVVAGAAWLVAMQRLRGGGGFKPWVAAAAVWALSQVVDATQEPNRYDWTVIPEEMLEMAGSLLFALALLIALREQRLEHR